MTKRTLCLAPLLVVVLVAAACTLDEEVRLPRADPGAARGGTLEVGITEPLSIDPVVTDALDPSGSLVTSTICDTLIHLDPRTGAPRPGIAESWQVADGGGRITIRLRRGVRFHDGSELVADDVVYALSRVAQRELASPVASILEPVAGYEQVHGNEEVSNESQRIQLSGLRVIEPYSFEIELVEDRADFFRVLSHPATAPVPAQAVVADPEGFDRRPICAGPYRVAEPWRPGEGTIRVTRFDGYYGRNLAHTGGGVGYADEIRFRIYADRAAQVAAFEAGEIHLAHAPAESVDELRDLGDDLVVASTPTLEYVGLPTALEPFDRRGVRIALSQAIDRQRLSDAVYAGVRRPATSILPPTLGPLHRPDACGPHAPLRGDVPAARSSLRRAGIDLTGQTIPFLYNDEFGHDAVVGEIARQWKEAFGVEVQPVPMVWDAFLDAGLRQPGFVGPFRMSWSPQYQAPDLYLAPLFESSSIGRDNFTRFSNHDFDRTLEREARRAVAEEDRRDGYQVLEELVCGEMPLIPLTYGSRPYLFRADVVGSAFGEWIAASSGTPVARELYLKQ